MATKKKAVSPCTWARGVVGSEGLPIVVADAPVARRRTGDEEDGPCAPVDVVEKENLVLLDTEGGGAADLGWDDEDALVVLATSDFDDATKFAKLTKAIEAKKYLAGGEARSGARGDGRHLLRGCEARGLGARGRAPPRRRARSSRSSARDLREGVPRASCARHVDAHPRARRAEGRERGEGGDRPRGGVAPPRRFARVCEPGAPTRARAPCDRRGRRASTRSALAWSRRRSPTSSCPTRAATSSSHAPSLSRASHRRLPPPRPPHHGAAQPSSRAPRSHSTAIRRASVAPRVSARSLFGQAATCVRYASKSEVEGVCERETPSPLRRIG